MADMFRICRLAKGNERAAERLNHERYSWSDKQTIGLKSTTNQPTTEGIHRKIYLTAEFPLIYITVYVNMEQYKVIGTVKADCE